MADAVLITQRTKFAISEKGETLRGVPQVAYEDIGGMKEEIRKVREMIQLPLRHPEIFEKLGVESPKGVLLYGTPGTGKTLLAKAVANESNAHFISISGPEIMSKFYGESEAHVREIFKEAREEAPDNCIHRRNRQHRSKEGRSHGGSRKEGGLSAARSHGRSGSARKGDSHCGDKSPECNRPSPTKTRKIRQGNRDQVRDKAGKI